MNTQPPDPPQDADPAIPDIGKSQRQYAHSSGDRNTKSSEGDWKGFAGGEQRDATPDIPSRRTPALPPEKP